MPNMGSPLLCPIIQFFSCGVQLQDGLSRVSHLLAPLLVVSTSSKHILSSFGLALEKAADGYWHWRLTDAFFHLW